MGHKGFYKRRRGILEHLEAGRISLLDLAVHDFICLKANAIVGNDSYSPPGVWIGSATAIHACCPRQITERAVQRSLDHLEKLGWIKRWMKPGKRGNYPILIARYSVSDMSGKECVVDAEATTDWKLPVLVPVGETSTVRKKTGRELSGNKELRKENREGKRGKPADKQQADPRFQAVVDHFFKRSEEQTGIKPPWDGGDGKALNRILADQESAAAEQVITWLDAAFDDPDQYPLRKGFRMTEFSRHYPKYAAKVGEGTLCSNDGTEASNRRYEPFSTEAIWHHKDPY